MITTTYFIATHMIHTSCTGSCDFSDCFPRKLRNWTVGACMRSRSFTKSRRRLGLGVRGWSAREIMQHRQTTPINNFLTLRIFWRRCAITILPYFQVCEYSKNIIVPDTNFSYTLLLQITVRKFARRTYNLTLNRDRAIPQTPSSISCWLCLPQDVHNSLYSVCTRIQSVSLRARNLWRSKRYVR